MPLVYLINFVVATATAVFAPGRADLHPAHRRAPAPDGRQLDLHPDDQRHVRHRLRVPRSARPQRARIDGGLRHRGGHVRRCSALAILPLPSVKPDHEARGRPRRRGARRARAVAASWRRALRFIRANRRIAWSLTYLGDRRQPDRGLGAIGPGFATDILLLRRRRTSSSSWARRASGRSWASSSSIRTARASPSGSSSTSAWSRWASRSSLLALVRPITITVRPGHRRSRTPSRPSRRSSA